MLNKINFIAPALPFFPEPSLSLPAPVRPYREDAKGGVGSAD
jgi:hypothetical protein